MAKGKRSKGGWDVVGRVVGVAESPWLATYMRHLHDLAGRQMPVFQNAPRSTRLFVFFTEAALRPHAESPRAEIRGAAVAALQRTEV